MKNRRLIIFDLLKIFAISLVVIFHNSLYLGFRDVLPVINIRPLLYMHLGTIGVSIFLFVSGGLLTLSGYTFKKWVDFKSFFLKRLIRLYPAYWIALIVVILLYYFADLFLGRHTLESLSGYALLDYLIFFSGFQSFFGKYLYGPISAAWFIGLIVTLYLLYPLFAGLFEKRPNSTLFLVFLISIISRWFIGFNDNWFDIQQWFPLSRLFEFGLGIWIVKKGIINRYTLNKINSSHLIIFLADISFYVF